MSMSAADFNLVYKLRSSVYNYVEIWLQISFIRGFDKLVQSGPWHSAPCVFRFLCVIDLKDRYFNFNGYQRISCHPMGDKSWQEAGS